MREERIGAKELQLMVMERDAQLREGRLAKREEELGLLEGVEAAEGGGGTSTTAPDPIVRLKRVEKVSSSESTLCWIHVFTHLLPIKTATAHPPTPTKPRTRRSSTKRDSTTVERSEHNTSQTPGGKRRKKTSQRRRISGYQLFIRENAQVLASQAASRGLSHTGLFNYQAEEWHRMEDSEREHWNSQAREMQGDEAAMDVVEMIKMAGEKQSGGVNASLALQQAGGEGEEEDSETLCEAPCEDESRVLKRGADWLIDSAFLGDPS